MLGAHEGEEIRGNEPGAALNDGADIANPPGAGTENKGRLAQASETFDELKQRVVAERVVANPQLPFAPKHAAFANVAGLQMIGRTFLGGSKRADQQVYARMLKNAKIDNRGNDVTIDLLVPQTDIDILIASVK